MKGRRDMERTRIRKGFLFIGLTMALAFLYPHHAQAVILGETGTTFNLTAKEGSIRTGDGDSVPMWGYAIAGRDMQFPGPTLIVNQGDRVSVTLTNQLRLPV